MSQNTYPKDTEEHLSLLDSSFTSPQADTAIMDFLKSTYASQLGLGMCWDMLYLC